MGKVILPYYISLLGKQLTVRTKVNMAVINTGITLSIEQQLTLCKEFTDKEIKEAMFSILNFKSPGLDGYNSGFYKPTWHTLGPLVCAAIKDFFTMRKMTRYFNAIKFVLIPKVQQPQTPADFRPISCCNVVSKCIAKLLSARIKQVLPILISQNQSALVPNWELLYNIMICQDII